MDNALSGAGKLKIVRASSSRRDEETSPDIVANLLKVVLDADIKFKRPFELVF